LGVAGLARIGADLEAKLGARLKLHVQVTANSNTITAYGLDYIEINRVRHANAVIVAADGPVHDWKVDSLERLRAEDFVPVLALDPELVLVGTGAAHRFLAPALLRPLIERGVGFEFMDTAAACRTFNILMGEGRHVVAALLPPGPAAGAEPSA
jgi:uncharacterized protein